MDSLDLTPDQVRRLMETAGRHLRYLNQLQRRMEQLGFPPDDALYRAASEARDGAAALFIAAHYCSCPSGVGVDRSAPAAVAPATHPSSSSADAV